MKRAVIGLDPGNVTGCFGVVIFVGKDGPPMSLTTHDELETALEVRTWLVRFIEQIEMSTDLIVGIERYVVTPRTHKLSRQPMALEVIGVAKAVCDEFGVKYRLQMKSEVAKLGNDGKLRLLGWYAPAKGHANDAARHALAALAHHDEAVFASLIRSVV